MVYSGKSVINYNEIDESTEIVLKRIFKETLCKDDNARFTTVPLG